MAIGRCIFLLVCFALASAKHISDPQIQNNFRPPSRNFTNQQLINRMEIGWNDGNYLDQSDSEVVDGRRRLMIVAVKPVRPAALLFRTHRLNRFSTVRIPVTYETSDPRENLAVSAGPG